LNELVTQKKRDESECGGKSAGFSVKAIKLSLIFVPKYSELVPFYQKLSDDKDHRHNPDRVDERKPAKGKKGENDAHHGKQKNIFHHLDDNSGRF
jgi:hypothetical protein